MGLSSAAGSVLGTVSANAAMNRIKDIDQQRNDDIVAQNTETSGDVVVISHSHDDIQANVIDQPSPAPVTTPDTNQNETPEPIIIVEPEPNTIVEIVYAGPIPDPNPIDPDIDPIVCVYGPPEPDILNDIDDSTDDFLNKFSESGTVWHDLKLTIKLVAAGALIMFALINGLTGKDSKKITLTPNQSEYNQYYQTQSAEIDSLIKKAAREAFEKKSN